MNQRAARSVEKQRSRSDKRRGRHSATQADAPSQITAQQFRQKPPRSLTEHAYERIKHLIITCALRPGEYVNESQLCERLGMGRTPVHQAIGQLHQERFVDVMPRKGIIVRSISLDEYFAIDEARLLLEVGAVRFATERITLGELKQLDAILERVKEARRNRDIEALLLCDRDFHFALAEATHNPVLETMLKSTYERSLRVWFMSSATMTVKEEEGILEQIARALRDRDPEKTSALMREHLLTSRSHAMRDT